MIGRAPYAAAKAHYDALNLAVEMAGKRLGSINGVGSGPMGLTPDSVKFSPEYREARAAYDRASSMARAFNGAFVREYRRELAEERAARRASGRL